MHRNSKKNYLVINSISKSRSLEQKTHMIYQTIKVLMNIKKHSRIIFQQVLLTTISNKSIEKAKKDRLQGILKIGIQNMMAQMKLPMMTIIGMKQKIKKKLRKKNKMSYFMSFFVVIQGQGQRYWIVKGRCHLMLNIKN